MQDHQLNLCIIFIIICFIAPSHKENPAVMAFSSHKTYGFCFLLFGTVSLYFFFFFIMYCLILVAREMAQKENIKLTNVKLHCLT